MNRFRVVDEPVVEKGLTPIHLKIIGACFLALSVASTTLIPRLLGGNTDDMGVLTAMVITEILSWAALPIYAWLLVEGYRLSRNRWAYGVKLLALAVVCEVPYDMVTSGELFDLSSQNPVFALLFGLALLAIVDYVRSHCAGVARYLLWLCAFGACELWMLLLRVGVRQRIMVAGCVLIAFVMIFALLSKTINTMMLTAGLFGAACFIMPALGVVILHYRTEHWCYESEHRVIRWVFYAIYPVMLMVGMLLNFV